MAKRRNSKLFKVGGCESVDMVTGETTPVEGGGFSILPGPPDTCEWCHVLHEATEPHDAQSLPYQMKFYTLHQRYPTWTDAMAHCPPEVQKRWRKHLVEVLKANNLEIPLDLR